jgi:hypothetical protein
MAVASFSSLAAAEATPDRASVSDAGAAQGWRNIGPLGLADTSCSHLGNKCTRVDGDNGGVIGGGFRSTSRATVGHGEEKTVIGYTWESLHTPQQGFISSLPRDGSTNGFNTNQLTSLNHYANHTVRAFLGRSSGLSVP